jgi:hypothetical protein
MEIKIALRMCRLDLYVSDRNQWRTCSPQSTWKISVQTFTTDAFKMLRLGEVGVGV